MRSFADLLCKDDPADEAGAILGRMMDLISAAHHALLESVGDNAERIANETTTQMEILMACAVRLDDGVDAVQRQAKRGFWREEAAADAEGAECTGA